MPNIVSHKTVVKWITAPIIGCAVRIYKKVNKSRRHKKHNIDKMDEVKLEQNVVIKDVVKWGITVLTENAVMI